MMRFDEYMDWALYGPEGFFTRGGGAGRAGSDFITSPEVGPLFGALVAQDLDLRWQGLGAPDPFFFVDVGAGRGRLGVSILKANPACLSALRYVLVESSAALRKSHAEYFQLEPAELALGAAQFDPEIEQAVIVQDAGPIVVSLPELPADIPAGVVFANELLDNLPTRIVARTETGWNEVHVAERDDVYFEQLLPATEDVASKCDDIYASVPVGSRLPLQTRIADWLREVAATMDRGFVVIVDYMATVQELVERADWLRTYHQQTRGNDPYVAPTQTDITTDVCIEYLESAARDAGFTVLGRMSQAMWLSSLGISEFVDAGRHEWQARAHIGDLQAIEAKSREVEARALTDPSGLGAHQVVILQQ